MKTKTQTAGVRELEDRLAEQENRIAAQERRIAQLEEHNRHLGYQARMLEHTADALISVNGNFTITYCNRAAARLLGVPGEAGGDGLTSRALADVVPELSSSLLPRLQQVYQSGQAYHGADQPVEMKRPRGPETVYLTYTLTPLFDAKQQVEGILILAIETTGEVRAKQAAESERALLDAVLEQMPVGVIIGEAPSGRLLRASGLTVKIFGPTLYQSRSIEEYRRWEAYDLSGRRYRPEEMPMARSIQRGEVVNEEIMTFHLPRGGERVMSVSSAPVYDPSGKVIAGVVLHEDITERREAERERARLHQEVENQRRLLQTVVDNTPSGLAVLQGPEHRYMMVNQAQLDIAAGKGELLGRTVAEVWPEARGHEAQALLNLVYRTGEPVHVKELHVRLERGGGELQDAYFNLDYIPLRSYTGQVNGMMLFTHEITAMVQARQRIEELARLHEERESLLRDVLENSLDAVYRRNLPGDHYDYLSPAVEQILGFTADEMMSMSIEEVLKLMHPDDVEATNAALAKSERTGRSLLEYRIRHKSGGYRWVADHITVQKDEHGRPSYRVGVLRDITERKQAEQALRESEKRLRTLVEANIIGIVYRDAEGHIRDGNDAYLEMIGYSRAEMETGLLNTFDITPPEYHALDRQAAQEVRELGRCYPYEKEYIRKDGTRVPLMVGFTRLDDQPTEFVGFIMNLSQLKEAQANLQDYADRLERSNTELEQFAYMASHDLQEPLRKIRSFGDVLKRSLKEDLDEQSLDYLQRMSSAADRMQAMITSLLELSRVNTRGQAFAPVALDSVAREVISDLETRIERSGGQVELAALPEIEADEMQMHQLLQNLIGNALKFHKPDQPPRVKVYAHPAAARHGAPEAVILVVEDNGIGMDEQDAARIFQPFERLHGRSEYEGAGMGLAICRKITERHRGSIHVKSQPGQGSRFIVRLPTRQPKE